MNLLYDLVANILAAFYAFIPNYAVAIILLTLLVMAITTPLTLKSTRSMMVMQQLQPEMKRIQQRYKDDRQKQNEELLKFYKENNINPVGGCVPLIVQMPVFFFLYQILRGLTRRVSDMGYTPGFNSAQAAIGTNLTTAHPWYTPFDPAYLDHSTKLYQSLAGSTSMNAFGMDLSLSLTETWSAKGLVYSIPYALLIGVVGFTSFYQQRQIQGRNPNATVNPQQQTLMKVMPIILPVISIGLPGGLVLYFAVSNLWRVGLQGFISRSIYGIKRGDRPTEAAKDARTSGGKPSGGAGGKGKGEGKANSAKQSSKGRKQDPDQRTPTEKPSAQGGKGAGTSSSRNGQKNQRGNNASASSQKSGPRKGREENDKNSGAQNSRSNRRPTRTSGSQSSRSSASGGNAAPSLQPRARKPKKR